jgi:hypothetical protein
MFVQLAATSAPLELQFPPLLSLSDEPVADAAAGTIAKVSTLAHSASDALPFIEMTAFLLDLLVAGPKAPGVAWLTPEG